MTNTKNSELIGRNVYLTHEQARYLSELGRAPGALNGNMSAGLRKAVEYARANMPLDKEGGGKH